MYNIVVLGTPSSGKSTLVDHLTEYVSQNEQFAIGKCVGVEEQIRPILHENPTLSIDDPLINQKVLRKVLAIKNQLILDPENIDVAIYDGYVLGPILYFAKRYLATVSEESPLVQSVGMLAHVLFNQFLPFVDTLVDIDLFIKLKRPTTCIDDGIRSLDISEQDQIEIDTSLDTLVEIFNHYLVPAIPIEHVSSLQGEATFKEAEQIVAKHLLTDTQTTRVLKKGGWPGYGVLLPK